MALQLSDGKVFLKKVASPFLRASPQKRMKWFLMTVLLGALAVGAEVWFYHHYRIAWDRQIIKCMDYRFLLVDLKDRALERDGLYAFKAGKQSVPIFTEGTLVGKYLKGLPGDEVEVRSEEVILINGKEVGRGMPHLAGMTDDQRRKYFGKRCLGEDEYWMMGTKPLSFDSRYWGPIRSEQIVARAYAIF